MPSPTIESMAKETAAVAKQRALDAMLDKADAELMSMARAYSNGFYGDAVAALRRAEPFLQFLADNGSAP